MAARVKHARRIAKLGVSDFETGLQLSGSRTTCCGGWSKLYSALADWPAWQTVTKTTAAD